MLRLAAVIAALGIGATVVYAQNLDAIKSRRDVMKAIATAGTINFKMMKGEAPFELAKVQAGLKVRYAPRVRKVSDSTVVTSL